MGKINGSRVILGGLLTGLVVNVFEWILNGVILKDRWNEIMKALGRPAEYTAGVMTVYICWAFLIGILAVWLYAAIRPRFGAGARTAVIAGVAAWLFVHLQGMILTSNMGLFPRDMLLAGTAVGLVEMVVGTVAGAWLYKEEQ